MPSNCSVGGLYGCRETICALDMAAHHLLVVAINHDVPRHLDYGAECAYFVRVLGSSGNCILEKAERWSRRKPALT